MPATLKVDSSQLKRKTNQLARLQGKTNQEVVKEEMRLWIKQTIKFTPPTGQQSRLSAKKQGEAAVTRDIGRAMFPLSPEDMTTKSAADAVRTNDVDALNAIITRSGGWKGWKADRFNPMLHREARNNRGRVPRSKKTYVTETRRWKKYVKDVKQRVGMAKGAWTDVYERVGGRAPKWQARHRNRGSAAANFFDSHNPTIKGINRASSNNETVRPLINARKVREKSIEKKLRRLMRENARKARLK